MSDGARRLFRAYTESRPAGNPKFAPPDFSADNEPGARQGETSSVNTTPRRTIMENLPEFSTYNGNFVTPYLAVGACPRPEHVPEIAAAGIRGILNVMSVAGRESFEYVAHLPPEIAWAHCGFWDGYFGPPERSANQVLCPSFARLVVVRASEMLRDHAPLLIHCGGGSGRSGNVAAIVVAARKGLTIDEAVAHLQQRRKVIARFFREGFWKYTPDDELLGIAREVLGESDPSREVWCARIRGTPPPDESSFERLLA
jgi:hypothetical protein